MTIKCLAFDSAEQFIQRVRADPRGCVVSDIRLLRMSGLELQCWLNERGYGLPIVFLTAVPRTSLTTQAMRQGAVAVLDKPWQDDELWDAIREATAISVRFHKEQTELNDIRRRVKTLTPGESQVVARILEGAPNKTIAAALDVSLRTVENRRRRVFQKLETDSVAILVQMMMKIQQDTNTASRRYSRFNSRGQQLTMPGWHTKSARDASKPRSPSRKVP